MPTKRPSNPDAQYIMRPEIGSVIAKGLSVVYKEKPENPVDYFAKWLLKQSEIAKLNQKENDVYKVVDKERFKYEWDLKNQAKEKARRDAALKEVEQELNSFKENIEKSEDLNDNLQALVDHIGKHTKSTACYIGKVVEPIRTDIKDDAFDDDHLIQYNEADKTTWPRIQFLAATKDHKFMINEILQQDEGLTYQLFKEQPAEGADPLIKPATEQCPMHLLVKEVVREPRIKFFQVPRLGSYLAIKLEYDSCLNEASFDAAISDYLEIDAKMKEIAKDKQDWHEEQQEKRLEAREANEIYNPPPEPTWPEVKPKEFQTKKECLVVGLNTMGQDREFTQQELEFALNTVQHFKECWEKNERKNLRADIQWKLDANDWDKDYKEFFAEQDEIELNKLVEDAIHEEQNRKNANGDDEMTEQEKENITKSSRFAILTKSFYAPEAVLEYKAKMEAKAALSGDGDQSQNRVQSAMSSVKEGASKEEKVDVKSADEQEEKKGPEYTPLVPEMWQEQLKAFSKLHVVKFPRIFQTLFYLTRFADRESVCYRDTNKLEWKKCRQHFVCVKYNEEIFKALANYKVNGAKEEEHKEYEKLLFLLDNLANIDEEAVSNYSQALAHLLHWIKDAMNLRTADVRARRKQKTIERDQRLEAQTNEQTRLERRERYIADKREEFEIKMQDEAEARKKLREEAGEDDVSEPDEQDEFDEDNNINDFNDENPPIDIPPEVVDDIDNDFNLPDEEESQNGD